MPVLTKKRAPASKPVIDYPRRGEVLTSERYTFRVSAPEGARSVELSVDDGPWHPCRDAAGHWWYDWSHYGSGRHQAAARCEAGDGAKAASVERKFVVNLSEGEGPSGE